MAVAPLSCSEFAFNSQLAELMAIALMELHQEFHIFERDDVTGIQGVIDAVNQFNPDAAIELHFNSFAEPEGSTPAIGSETLHGQNPASRRLARFVQNAVVVTFQRSEKNNRGCKRLEKTDRGYLNVNGPKCPYVLVEPFFGDEIPEAALASAARKDLANALAQALVGFCENEAGA